MLLNRSVLSISIAAALLFTGCSSKGNLPTDLKPERFNDGAIEEMRVAAVEARDELRLLAKARDGVAQVTMTQAQRTQRFEQATSVPAGFERIVTIPKFNGTIEQAVTLVAKLAGYSFGIPQGLPPRTPMLVSLNIRNKPLNEALKELGMQTGDGALIKVLPKTKQMVLQYTDTDSRPN